MSIYVETHIAGTIDDLLDKTQRPDLHERWDLRFTHIDYLPRPDENLAAPARPSSRFLTPRSNSLAIAASNGRSSPK